MDGPLIEEVKNDEEEEEEEDSKAKKKERCSEEASKRETSREPSCIFRNFSPCNIHKKIKPLITP